MYHSQLPKSRGVLFSPCARAKPAADAFSAAHLAMTLLLKIRTGLHRYQVAMTRGPSHEDVAPRSGKLERSNA